MKTLPVCLLRLALLPLLLLAAVSLAAETPAAQTDPPPHELVNRLRAGGYVIYLRHAATDHRIVDQHNIRLDDCLTQRNLSVQGRRQARDIGAAIRALGIPVGTVTSSPYCRCRDTAIIAFSAHVIDDDLASSILKNAENTRRVVESLRRMLARPPAAGTNNVIISHSSNLKAATDIWPKPEGIAIVFRPIGHQGYQYVGRILPDQWRELQAAR